MLNEVQRLKIDLYVNGMTVSNSARSRIAGRSNRPLTMADYASTSGIALRLAQNIWVNAPIEDYNHNFVSGTSPYTLDWTETEGFVLTDGKRWFWTAPVIVPNYATQYSSQGTPFSSLGVTHSDRVRISPIQGCAIECKFCDFPYRANYSAHRTGDLLESLEMAVSDPRTPAKHILISGGTPRKRDYEYLNSLYDSVLTRFPDLDVDVMMAPMPGLLDPRRLKEAGVNALSINLELFNEDLAKELMKGKYRLSRQGYLDFIESAVQEFGISYVRSLVMVGIEPIEDTLRAVEALAVRGCEPLLSAFRPDPKTPMADWQPPTAEFLEEVYLRSRDIVERFDVKLGPRCIACQHNVLAFPDDSDYYFYYEPNDQIRRLSETQPPCTA